MVEEDDQLRALVSDMEAVSSEDDIQGYDDDFESFANAEPAPPVEATRSEELTLGVVVLEPHSGMVERFWNRDATRNLGPHG